MRRGRGRAFVIWRLIKPQGAVGIAASLLLAVLLLMQRADARKWRGEAERDAIAFQAEKAAHGATIANYRLAAEEARRADAANVQRVQAEQSAINQRSDHDFQARLDDARIRAERLQQQAGPGASNAGIGRAAAVPGIPPPPQAADSTSGEARLPLADRLTATEQAVQLDELIKWVNAQQGVMPESKEGTARP